VKRITEPVANDVLTSAALLGVRIAVAESLTGGILAGSLIDVPGASTVFSGGIVAYDTFLKVSLLGVSPVLLSRFGPVDPEVARQMAAGVRHACAVPPTDKEAPRTGPSGKQDHVLANRFSETTFVFPADIGVATTGVAGPDPDPQTCQPAGTVWVGVSSLLGDRAVSLRLTGTRAEIRAAVVTAALRELRTELESLRSARAV
jgi:nicotinamide-nucleotide amidase